MEDEFTSIDYLAGLISRSVCCNNCELKFKCDKKSQDMKSNNNFDGYCYLTWHKFLRERFDVKLKENKNE